MLTLTATQSAMVALGSKTIKWAYYIYDSSGVGYSFVSNDDIGEVAWITGILWETGTEWDTGDSLSSVVLTDFSGIELRRNMAENTIIAPSDVSFTISNPSNTLIFGDFKGGTVLIELWLSDGTSDKKIAGWKFRIKTAKPDYQNMRIVAEDWIQHYLKGDYPNTRIPNEIFPSNRTYQNKALCVPYPFGTAYVPLRDVFITADGYILLGDTTNTYTISAIRSPRSTGAKSEWDSGTYVFTQSTEADVDAVDWRVFQAIIADSDNDGTVDAHGSWLSPGGPCLDPPVKFTRSDTASTTSPADVIQAVLIDMGVPSTMIDATTFATAKGVYSGWGLTFNGAFWYKQPRQKVLANLLTQCHSCLQIGEKIELHVKVKASQTTITEVDVLRTTQQGKGTFSYRDIANQDLTDSGYIAFQESGEAQDEYIKVLESADAAANHISNQIVECPFVQDSQDVRKIGKLHWQRKLLKHAELVFTTKGTKLAIQPDDVVTINAGDYGGNYAVLVDSIKIKHDLSIQFRCSRFETAFDDWGDLAPGALTVATDSTNQTAFWRPVMVGPDTETPDVGAHSNVLSGRLRLGSGADHIVLDPTTLRISLFDNGTENFRVGDLNGFLGYVAETFGLGIGEVGKSLRYDAVNGLRVAGAISASTIDIGGADATSFHVDADGNMWLGAAAFNIGTNPFAVSSAGVLRAVSGTIGAWTLGATTITSANITLDQGNDKITVNTLTIDGANNRIRSGNYVSGAAGAGFTLEPDLLEVGNIAARGIIRTAVFQKDVVSAVGGNLMVLPADLLSTDMTAADASTLTIEGNETFAVGDFLRIKDGIDDEWFEVTNIGAAPTYTATRDKAADYGADANPIWKKGASVVNYKQSGDGGLLLTSSEANAPYLSIFTHAGAPWTTITTNVREGNLNGYAGYAADTYGWASYIDATNYIKIDAANGIRMSGTITIGEADGLSIAAAGNVVVQQGGDIIMAGGAAGDPSLIRFKDEVVSGELRFERSADPADYWYIKKVATNNALLINPTAGLAALTPSLFIGATSTTDAAPGISGFALHAVQGIAFRIGGWGGSSAISLFDAQVFITVAATVISGTLSVGAVTCGIINATIQAGIADYDKFLVSDGGVVKYRTGTETLDDISGDVKWA